jgi:hypothetical protein
MAPYFVILKRTTTHTYVLARLLQWPSYDRTWFSGPDKQEIFIFIVYCILTQKQFNPGNLIAAGSSNISSFTVMLG